MVSPPTAVKYAFRETGKARPDYGELSMKAAELSHERRSSCLFMTLENVARNPARGHKSRWGFEPVSCRMEPRLAPSRAAVLDKCPWLAGLFCSVSKTTRPGKQLIGVVPTGFRRVWTEVW